MSPVGPADGPAPAGSSGSGPLVEARDIGVRRGERWLIRHVDLQVPRGELVYLIGANGAGKSTCAKSILGLIDIDEGTLERAPGLAVGYVPQRLAVSHTLPLRLRRMMKLTGRFAARDIDAALAAVGLERLGDPPVTSLSGGELQRLLLARAMIHRPDLLVLDEPAQGVDVAGARVLHDLIDGIRDNLGCGVLLISPRSADGDEQRQRRDRPGAARTRRAAGRCACRDAGGRTRRRQRARLTDAGRFSRPCTARPA